MIRAIHHISRTVAAPLIPMDRGGDISPLGVLAKRARTVYYEPKQWHFVVVTLKKKAAACFRIPFPDFEPWAVH